MTTIQNRVTKLESQILPTTAEPGRIIRVLGRLDMSADQLKAWLLDRGIDLFTDDRLIYRHIVEPAAQATSPLVLGVMTVKLSDPVAGTVQQFQFDAAA